MHTDIDFIKSQYTTNIQKRSFFKYFIGLIPRIIQFVKHERARRIARNKGAIIGQNVVLPIALAKRANKNLIIGDNTSVQTSLIDLRNIVRIGNNVIIGSNSEIITTSHNIDSTEWEQKNYGISIDDYVWIPTNVLVLPSCRNIGRGAVIASGSVVAKNIEEMTVNAGNPAQVLRKRKNVHSDLIVESLLGGDLLAYLQARRKK